MIENSILYSPQECQSVFLMRFVDISFEEDPPRAISSFLFFCGGMLGTSSN